MPKTITKQETLYKFDELPTQAAKDRAVQQRIKWEIDDYDNTPERCYSGETIQSLGFAINGSQMKWSGLDWIEWDFVWEGTDGHKLSWNGTYTWKPDWRTKYAEAPYFGPTEEPALMKFGERLEALQAKHDYKLRARMKHQDNTYYGYDFAEIVFVDEDGEDIEDDLEYIDNPNYAEQLARWEDWMYRHIGDRAVEHPKTLIPKTTMNPRNADLPEFVEIVKGIAAWWRQQLQEHWEGVQDPKYTADLLREYGDWFYASGEKAYDADEVNDD